MRNEEKPVQALKAHLALNVKDVEGSIAFYQKLLGIAPSKVRTGYAKFDVQNPPLNLTLNQHAFNERGALSHLGIQVASTDDVLATRERWIAAGLLTRDEMQTDCCYARQDKTWVHDPDGNEWEVFVVLEDNLPETAPCACGTKLEDAASSNACCGTAAPIAIKNDVVRSCENVAITDASAGDLKEILELLSQVNLPHDGVAERLSTFLVARDETSQLIATIGLERHGHTALLRSVAVAPEYQSCGIGSQLTEQALGRATKDGLERVVLLTATARDFFEKHFGFCETPRSVFDQELKESPEWNLPRCSSAVCMSLDLRGK